ncbi:MAG: hypothetical protein IJU37_08340 [Desulfovibrio sp.]|nr:hypothetical protein [Desulfovibrio sp.]
MHDVLALAAWLSRACGRSPGVAPLLLGVLAGFLIWTASCGDVWGLEAHGHADGLAVSSDFGNAAGGDAGEVRELWIGKMYTSTFRVGICYSPEGNVRGVALLKQRNGDVDVYHIFGVLRDNEIQARHASGHIFRGRLVSEENVEGVITLKSGLRVRLEGRREHNAHLADEDCAPLP